MKKVLITAAALLLCPAAAFAITPISDFQNINRQIAVQQIETYMDGPDSDGLPGVFLGALIDEPPSEALSCAAPSPPPPSEPPDAEKKTHLEVSLITETSSAPQGTVQSLPPISQFTPKFMAFAFKDLDSRQPTAKPTSTNSLNFTEIQRYADQARNQIESGSIAFSLFPNMDDLLRKSCAIEALIQTVPQLKGLSDDQISQQIASYLSKSGKTDEDKYELLVMLRNRIAANYNTSRNPGANNSINNPNHEPLPPGNISQVPIFTATANLNPFGGGVCNDYSQSIAGIGAHLFPKDDVLTITSGSHFGVIITDGTKTRVIDGGGQFLTSQQLELVPGTGVTNARISKVVNGQLREIAVITTQLGDAMNIAFKSDQPQLKTGASINDVFSTAKLVFEQNDQKKRELSLTGGTAKISDSNVTVIVVKYETFSEKNHAYIGAGLDNQNFSAGQKPQMSFNFRAGYDRTIFRYVTPRMKMDFKSGIHLDGMMAMPADAEAMAGTLEIVNKLHVESRGTQSKGIQFNGDAQLINSLGPSSWGNTSGAMSTVSIDGVKKTLANMTFHLNQVVVNGSVVKTFNEKTSSRTDAFYQGSNIGQAASLTSGIQRTYPSGSQFYVFTGLESSAFKGFETQHSLLVGPTGGKVGAEYQGPKGSNVGVQVQGIGSDAGAQVNATAKILIKGKKRKKLPAETAPEIE